MTGPPITLGELALSLALGQLGQREYPPGSNRGGMIDEYLRAVHLDPTKGQYPWCAAFVCWCVKDAGRRLAMAPKMKFSASVKRLYGRNKKHVVTEPRAGDIYVHLNPDGTGHCGIVFGSELNDVAGVEGNTDEKGGRTGGKVMHQRRPLSYVTAFLRPA